MGMTSSTLSLVSLVFPVFLAATFFPIFFRLNPPRLRSLASRAELTFPPGVFFLGFLGTRSGRSPGCGGCEGCSGCSGWIIMLPFFPLLTAAPFPFPFPLPFPFPPLLPRLAVIFLRRTELKLDKVIHES